ncbi:CocE/NonD family hydrolase C-terminal non-catalytic domain-containing protein [Streptomyces sp. NPDC007905]|uniref:CocE/NonD family hydrolase C-terminal non-catalytic domain-containing protein n=1 Tax=Streptomyces sp. NPDC007905 TaxID=3364788 RepID=UPI0036E88DA4
MLKHAGALRVSARHLDKAMSRDTIPAHTFDRVEKLAPGEIADVEIDMLPVGLVFYPGQQLRLVISAHNPLGPMMPTTRQYVPGTADSTSSTSRAPAPPTSSSRS